MYYDKLVRDNIPDIINKNGSIPITYILEKDSTYEYYLKEKLNEELSELKAANKQEDKIEEICDVIEVLYSLSKLYGCEENELNNIRLDKKLHKGGFEKRIYLKETKSI